MARIPLSEEERCEGCRHLREHANREFVDYICSRFNHPVGRRFFDLEKQNNHGWGTERIEDSCHEG